MIPCTLPPVHIHRRKAAVCAAVASVSVLALVSASPASAQDVTAPLGVTAGTLGFAATPAAPSVTPVTLDGRNKTTSASLPLSVGDARGSGAGWKVQVAATQFTTGGPTPRTLPPAAIAYTSTTAAACAAGVDCAAASNSAALNGTLSTTPLTVFNAATDSGMGEQLFTPSFTISLPARTYAGAYNSTWTVTLVTGP
jgi:hypothetical protein